MNGFNLKIYCAGENHSLISVSISLYMCARIKRSDLNDSLLKGHTVNNLRCSNARISNFGVCTYVGIGTNHAI